MQPCPYLSHLEGALLFLTFVTRCNLNYYVYVLVHNASLQAFHLQVTQDTRFKLHGGLYGLCEFLIHCKLDGILMDVSLQNMPPVKLQILVQDCSSLLKHMACK